MRPARLIVVLVASVLGTPAAALGQGEYGGDDPAESAWRFGPLALAPVLTTNLGWDSNVFQQQGPDPASDMTAGLRPDVHGWLRAGPARASFRSVLDYAYFRDHQTERSLDSLYEVTVRFPYAWVTPYVSADWINAKQRFGFEIDERTRRKQQSLGAGVNVRLGSRTHVDVAVRRNRLEFIGSAGRDPLLSDFHDYTSRGWGVTLRRDLTPLTSVLVNVDRYRDVFDRVPERNSRGFAVYTGLEFKPSALISGRAVVGWSKVRLVDPGAPSFRGFVASIDLAYTLRGATRFAVEARRDLSYSAMRGQHAYLLSGVRGSVTHHLSGGWDVGGRVGRYRTGYGLFALADPDSTGQSVVADRNHEIVTDYGGQVGYRLGPDTRVAVDLGRYHRRSTVDPRRRYVATRAGMVIRYRF